MLRNEGNDSVNSLLIPMITNDDIDNDIEDYNNNHKDSNDNSNDDYDIDNDDYPKYQFMLSSTMNKSFKGEIHLIK